jgi:ribosomal protein S18 acetylase RimI-like enzyme
LEDLLIRKLHIEDAESICRIQESITKEPSTIDYRRAAEQEAKNQDGVSFVAELDGKVVGFIITYIIYGGFGLEKSAWIGLFGVDPKYMDRGIGQKMAQKVFVVLKKGGIRNIFTSVMWDSTDLLSFFKSLGFERCEFINLKRTID